MSKISLVFWSMGELDILLSRFTDLYSKTPGVVILPSKESKRINSISFIYLIDKKNKKNVNAHIKDQPQAKL